jgi:hypothetical protein
MRAHREGVRARSLIALSTQAGFPVTPAMLARWHRDGLLPPPTVRSLGRGRGTESIYPEGARDQFEALCKFRKQTRDLDRVAWALWWQGFELPEQIIRRALGELMNDLQELERFASCLGEDDGSAPDEVYDAAWEKFERLVRRSRKRVAARLARKFGFIDWRDLLRVGLRVLSGTFSAATDLSNDMLSPVVSVVPGMAWSTSMLVTALQEVAPALRVSLLHEALENADLNELNQARDEVRVLVCALDGSFTCLLRKMFASDFGDERFRSILDDDSTLQRYSVLLWLAHRKNPAAHFGIRRLVIDLGNPQLRDWLEAA